MDKTNPVFIAVCECRQKQKAYFKTREPGALQASINAEMIVDNLIGKKIVSDEKKERDFIDLARQMRHNQKRFFKFLRPEIKKTAIELEKQIDKIIDDVNNPQLGLWS